MVKAQQPGDDDLNNAADDTGDSFCRIYALDQFEARIVRDIAAAMSWTTPREETYYHITSTMRPHEGAGVHWVAAVVEIEKTGKSEATAMAAGTAVT